MRKKGQSDFGIGMILVTFIAILVGVILFQAVAQQAGASTNTALINISSEADNTGRITVPADGIFVDLVGQEIITTPVVIMSNGTAIPATNFTITEGVSTTSGVKTIRYLAIGSSFTGVALNASYEYGPDGYIENGGARAITGLIALFFALGIAVVALTPTMRQGVLDMFK